MAKFEDFFWVLIAMISAYAGVLLEAIIVGSIIFATRNF